MIQKPISLHSIQSERHALSSLVKFPDLFPEVEGMTKEQDFNNETHAIIYRVIKNSFGQKEKLNSVLLAAKIQNLGINKFENDLDIGDYVNSLYTLPVKKEDGLSHFKTIISLRIKRDINALGAKIAEEARNPKNESVSSLITSVDKIYGETVRNTIQLNESKCVNLFDSMESLIEGIGNNPPDPNKYPIGPFPLLHSMIGSLHRKGNITLYAARSGVGKALRTDCKILTESGWKKIGDAKIGDEIAGSDGKFHKITGVFPQGKKKLFKVTMSDGRSTICCDEHLWFVNNHHDRNGVTNGRVLPLKDIIKWFDKKKVDYRGFKTYEYSIPFAKPIEFSEKKFDLHPYLLGFLIGDGYLKDSTVSFSSYESEKVEIVRSLLPIGDKLSNGAIKTTFRIIKDDGVKNKEKYGNNSSETWNLLNELKLTGHICYDKFIPEEYKFGSVDQRLELLRGLMDTDGSVENHGNKCSASFSTTSERLAYDVLDLVRGLGGRASFENKNERCYISKHGKQLNCAKSYEINFSFGNGVNPFRVSRKKDIFTQSCKSKHLFIHNIEQVEDGEAICISVGSPDKLFVTDDYIVTHNTNFMFYMNVFVAEKYGLPIYWNDVGELSLEELQLRAASCLSEGRVPMFAIENGSWRKNQEYTKIIRDLWPRIKKLKLYYEDVSDMGPNEIISAARRFSFNTVGRNIDFIWCIDYLKPFDDTEGESEWRQFGKYVKALKNFIKNELNVNLQTGIQSNRSGISNGKSSKNVDNSENSVSQDRVLQQVSNAIILRRKTFDEIERETTDYGNMKLYWNAKTRHLGKDVERALNYIKNLDGVYEPNFLNLDCNNFHYLEIGDGKQMYEALSQDKHDTSNPMVKDDDMSGL
jgi:replicative DNA helicase